MTGSEFEVTFGTRFKAVVTQSESVGNVKSIIFCVTPSCTGCIGKIVNSSSKDSRDKKCFTCPSCRNIIKYGHDGIKGLPANTGLDNAVKR